jgi:hypothetical protein
VVTSDRRDHDEITLLLTIALLFAQSSLAPGAGKKAEITAIKALMFDDRTGQFSKDLSDPNISLRNTTIGENSLGVTCHSTLVIVEINGQPEQLAASGSRVNFVATYKV